MAGDGPLELRINDPDSATGRQRGQVLTVYMANVAVDPYPAPGDPEMTAPYPPPGRPTSGPPTPVEPTMTAPTPCATGGPTAALSAEGAGDGVETLASPSAPTVAPSSTISPEPVLPRALPHTGGGGMDRRRWCLAAKGLAALRRRSAPWIEAAVATVEALAHRTATGAGPRGGQLSHASPLAVGV